MAITATTSGTTISPGIPVIVTLGGNPIAGDSVTVSITSSSGAASAETVTVQQNQELSSVASALATLLQADDVISAMVETLLVTDGVELYQTSIATGDEILAVFVTTGGAQQIVQTLYDLTTAQMTARLKSNFPANWDSSDAMQTGVANALFTTIGQQLAYIISQLQYDRNAARIPTSVEPELSLAADDFFGLNVLPPPAGYTDSQYAKIILGSLFPNADTRSAIETAVTTLTGVRPRMMEPWNPGDTGCWSSKPVVPWIVNVDFISVPAIPGNATFVRNSIATYIDQNGNIVQVDSGVPRFVSGQGLLIEAAGVNWIRNPTVQAASTSDLPYYWSTTNVGQLTAYSAGYGWANTDVNFSSIVIFDLGFGGTVTSPSTATVYMEAAQAVDAAVNQSWTLSFYCRQSYGLIDTVQFNMYLEEEDSSGAVLDSYTIPFTVPVGWPFDLNTMRVSATFQTVNPSTVYVRPGIVISTPTAGSYNAGIWIAGPQLEQTVGPTSLMIPIDADITYQSGTLTQGIRAGDSMTMIMPAQVNSAGQLSNSLSVMVEYDQLATPVQGVALSLSDYTGTFNNSLYLYTGKNGGGFYWNMPAVTAGGFHANGAQYPGVTRIAIGLNVAGISTASNGVLDYDIGMVLPVPQYTLLALGASWGTSYGSTVGDQFAGYMRRFAIWPYKFTDTQLTAASLDSWFPGLSASYANIISFWDEETRANPSRWSSPIPWNGFIETPLTVLSDVVGIALV